MCLSAEGNKTEECESGLKCKNGGECYKSTSGDEACQCESAYTGDECQFTTGLKYCSFIA